MTRSAATREVDSPTDIHSLKTAIALKVHGPVEWLYAVPIVERVAGRRIWEGEVHVLEVEGVAPKRQLFGWVHARSEGPPEVVVIERVPPSSSARAAVRLWLAERQKVRGRAVPRSSI